MNFSEALLNRPDAAEDPRFRVMAFWAVCVAGEDGEMFLEGEEACS